MCQAPAPRAQCGGARAPSLPHPPTLQLAARLLHTLARRRLPQCCCGRTALHTTSLAETSRRCSATWRSPAGGSSHPSRRRGPPHLVTCRPGAPPSSSSSHRSSRLACRQARRQLGSCPFPCRWCRAGQLAQWPLHPPLHQRTVSRMRAAGSQQRRRHQQARQQHRRQRWRQPRQPRRQLCGLRQLALLPRRCLLWNRSRCSTIWQRQWPSCPQCGHEAARLN